MFGKQMLEPSDTNIGLSSKNRICCMSSNGVRIFRDNGYADLWWCYR